MNSAFRKIVSAALAAVLLVGSLPARASEALGHDLAASDTLIGAGTQLGAGTFWSDSRSDLRQENYVVYTPGTAVRPVIAYGETSRSLTTTAGAAAELEAQGWRVVAGINGDYYDTSNGLPIGSTMVNGTFRNLSGDKYYAVGFRADGSAVIGDPQLSMRTAVNGADGFPVFALNYIRHSEYGISLYDSTFNTRHTTGTSEPGVDVLCSVEGGALNIGGTLMLRVDEVLPEATDTPIPEGKYLFTANLKAGEGTTAPLLALQPGDEIALRVESASGNPAWNEAVNLIGAPELLVENGAVCPGLPTGSAPRTAIGQRADGSLVFYTIDGRKTGYSVGATLEMVAMRLIELGCVAGVALDGGGSTTLVATMPNARSAVVVNTPSEGRLRAVSNHVLLVAPNTPSGMLDHIYLAPSAVRALPGASVSLTAAAVDTNYIPMDAPIELSADAGSLSGNLLTLPAAPGTVAVTASCGGVSAQARIEAAEPEAIVVKRSGSAVTSLAIQPGSTVSLTAQGVTNHLPLAGGNECFAWTYEGDGVTLADSGSTLVASSDAGAGTLTVSIGSKSVQIPVTVAPIPFRVGADFEGYFETGFSEDGKTAISHEDNGFRVHNGRGSARLDYTAADPTDAEAFAASVIPVNYPVASGCDTWSLWYLAEKQSAFDLVFDNGERAGGIEYRADANGWQLASGKVPAGATAIVGIAGFYAPDIETGTVWLDQLVFLHGDFDTAAPAVSLALDAETNTLTGRAFDAHDGAALPTLRLTYDREALPYSFDSRTGMLAAALPAPDGLTHHIALTAGDAAGNLARTSVVIPAAADAAPAFPDAEGHWAAGSIEFLKRIGVTIGDDKGLYNPDARITRQEFAVMLYRYLAPQGDFSGTSLPFADADKIAPWALDAARAMYALGVVNGSAGEGGKVYYNSTSDITRREAATMLGRLLEKGYAAPALPYADSAGVPAWAAEHVAVLGSLGVFDDFVTDTFDPLRALNRAEMAAMLMRLN